MMSKHVLVSLVFLLAAMASTGQQEEKQLEYASLLTRVKNGDLSIDFKQLRLSYMDSPERHKAKDTSNEEREMRQLLGQKDYKKAIENAEVVLANEFVNLDGHFVEYRAYQELHNSTQSEFHHGVFNGLLKSITDSGDGLSPKTAYIVISTHEEYVILNVRGLRPNKQSVLHDDGHSYDRLEALDPDTKETVTLYFNVDIPFKHYLE